MDPLKQGVAWTLILIMLNLCFPVSGFSQDKSMPAGEEITAHPLEVRSTPKEEMDVETVEKKSRWWLWGLLGAALIGGAVAAGGSDSGGDDPEGDTGGIRGSW